MHESVLLKESLEFLNLSDDSIIVDCTLGYGGHSSNILKKYLMDIYILLTKILMQSIIVVKD